MGKKCNDRNVTVVTFVTTVTLRSCHCNDRNVMVVTFFTTVTLRSLLRSLQNVTYFHIMFIFSSSSEVEKIKLSTWERAQWDLQVGICFEQKCWAQSELRCLKDALRSLRSLRTCQKTPFFGSFIGFAHSIGIVWNIDCHQKEAWIFFYRMVPKSSKLDKKCEYY